MMVPETNLGPSAGLAEYSQLKLEQIQRIGFRDNMIFVQLAANGSVISWALTNAAAGRSTYALLIVPWICFILGWTYIANDHKISVIGEYIRVSLKDQVRSELAGGAIEPFTWERFHRVHDQQRLRKAFQWGVDQMTFSAPGFGAVVGFLCLIGQSNVSDFLIIVVVLEFILMIGLFSMLTWFADFGLEPK